MITLTSIPAKPDRHELNEFNLLFTNLVESFLGSSSIFLPVK